MICMFYLFFTSINKYILATQWHVSVISAPKSLRQEAHELHVSMNQTSYVKRGLRAARRAYCSGRGLKRFLVLTSAGYNHLELGYRGPDALCYPL